MTCRKILIVEDEFWVGLNIQTTLSGAGFDVTGPAVNVLEAKQLLDDHHFDVAVLDINLGDETSNEIAYQLSRLKVPFIFLSGYERDNLSPEFIDIPLIEKPFDEEELINVIREIC